MGLPPGAGNFYGDEDIDPNTGEKYQHLKDQEAEAATQAKEPEAEAPNGDPTSRSNS